MLEDNSTIVLGERLEGYVRGNQYPRVRRDVIGLCSRTPALQC